MRVLRRSVLLNEFASSYTWTSRQSTLHHEGQRCRSGQQGPNLDSLPKRHQTWLLCLLRWREAYSRQSAADIRSAAISFVDVSLRVRDPGGTGKLESPETGLFVGNRFQRQALTQSVGRNDTELHYRVYCGGVPRIRGTARRKAGPLRFDQHATCTCPWKRAKSD